MCNGIICERGLITSVLLGRPPEWNKLIVSQTCLERLNTKLHYTGKIIIQGLARRLILFKQQAQVSSSRSNILISPFRPLKEGRRGTRASYKLS